MARYRADNGKIVDTDKMDYILDLSYEGCDVELYRTKKSHTWYQVSESRWSGEGNISGADEMPLKDVTAIIMEQCPDDINEYPELLPFASEVVDE